VALTVFSGDPDIYASFDTSRPTAANHSFASAGSGDEVLRISHLSPHFCAAAPCTLYIGVLGYTNASFSLLASLRDEQPLRLVDGQPQSDALEAGAWRYFEYRLANASEGFSVAVRPSYGDPDVFVSNTGAVPTQAEHGWAGYAYGADVVRVGANTSVAGMGAVFCAGCTYHIGVHCASATEYSITAARLGGVTLLQGGVPSEGEVFGGGYARFRFLVADMNAGVHVRLEAARGGMLPQLFASFGAAPDRNSATFYAAVAPAPHPPRTRPAPTRTHPAPALHPPCTHTASTLHPRGESLRGCVVG
jgi:hypothetical protein